jgi:DNA-binding PadR family transcriptional regulator
MSSRIYLGELEELVLLLVAMFNNEAYGTLLTQELEKQAGREISISAVHAVLHRLEEKGFVKSRMGGATVQRGGRQKRLFNITAAGRKAIAEIHETRNTIWEMLSKVSPA